MKFTADSKTRAKRTDAEAALAAGVRFGAHAVIRFSIRSTASAAFSMDCRIERMARGVVALRPCARRSSAVATLSSTVARSSPRDVTESAPDPTNPPPPFRPPPPPSPPPHSLPPRGLLVARACLVHYTVLARRASAFSRLPARFFVVTGRRSALRLWPLVPPPGGALPAGRTLRPPAGGLHSSGPFTRAPKGSS